MALAAFGAACSFEFRLGVVEQQGRDAGTGSEPDAVTPVPVDSSCADPSYVAWHCEKKTFLRDDNVPVEVELRYNHLDGVPDGTVIWVSGGDGHGSFRKDTGVAPIQDTGASRKIRSVEIDFIGPDGYWAAPAPGFVANGRLIDKVIRELQASRMVEGRWATYVGVSEGATIGAAALARTDLGKIVNRFVFVSGPYLSSAAAACTDPSSPDYIDVDAQREAFDRYNGWTAAGTCKNKQPSSLYGERSVFGPGASTNYPGVHVHVILGADDAQGPWIVRANEAWFRQIVTPDKSRYVMLGVGHAAAGGPSVAPSTALTSALERIEHFVLKASDAPVTAAPKLTFSLTLGGPPITTASQSTTVYGRVENLASRAAGACIEFVESPLGVCALPAGFSPIGPPWVWDEPTHTFQTSFKPNIFGSGPGKNTHYWRDSVTQAHADAVAVEVTP